MAGRYDLSTESQVRGRIHELAESLPGETPGEQLVRSMAATERPGPSADDLFRATARSQEVSKQLAWPDPGPTRGPSSCTWSPIGPTLRLRSPRA